MSISANLLSWLGQQLQREFGVQPESLQPSMVNLRLQGVAEKLGYSSPEALLQAVQAPSETQLRLNTFEALLNNETRFLRDQRFFELLQQRLLPDYLQQHKPQPLRIWSAACSSGQEAYSLAMVWLELGAPSVGLELLASDISRPCLQQAEAGLYPARELQGLPPGWQERYFERKGELYAVRQRLRTDVRFAQINLVTAWPSFPLQDVICLRNVLIYLTPAHRQAVVERLIQRIKPGGYLLLGATESLVPLPAGLQAAWLDQAGGCFRRL
ncbi:MAG: CheR family methyltransferase [Candidatus Sericytochromatia bacterium]